MRKVPVVLVLLLSSVISGYFFFYVTKQFLELDVFIENARYFLSSIVQSQATILGLLVTTSLVVLQLTASWFSPRAAAVFKESVLSWLIFGVYSISLLYNIALLQLLTTKISPVFLSISYTLFCISILFLPPFLWRLLTIVNPHSFMERVIKNINVRAPDFHILTNMIRTIVTREDYDTLDFTIETITKRSKCVIQRYSSPLASDMVGTFCKELAKFLSTYGVLVNEQVMDKAREDLLSTLLLAVTDLASTAIRARLYVVNIFLHVITDIGLLAIEKSSEKILEQTPKAVELIAVNALRAYDTRYGLEVSRTAIHGLLFLMQRLVVEKEAYSLEWLMSLGKCVGRISIIALQYMASATEYEYQSARTYFVNELTKDCKKVFVEVLERIRSLPESAQYHFFAQCILPLAFLGHMACKATMEEVLEPIISTLKEISSKEPRLAEKILNTLNELAGSRLTLPDLEGLFTQYIGQEDIKIVWPVVEDDDEIRVKSLFESFGWEFVTSFPFEPKHRVEAGKSPKFSDFFYPLHPSSFTEKLEKFFIEPGFLISREAFLPGYLPKSFKRRIYKRIFGTLQIFHFQRALSLYNLEKVRVLEKAFFNPELPQPLKLIPECMESRVGDYLVFLFTVFIPIYAPFFLQHFFKDYPQAKRKAKKAYQDHIRKQNELREQAASLLHQKG